MNGFSVIPGNDFVLNETVKTQNGQDEKNNPLAFFFLAKKTSSFAGSLLNYHCSNIVNGRFDSSQYSPRCSQVLCGLHNQFMNMSGCP